MFRILIRLTDTAFRPARAFRRLLSERKGYLSGLKPLLFAGSLFLITSAVLAVTGAVPLAPVYLPVEAENYYFWQMFLIIPLVLVMWFVLMMMGSLVGKQRRGERAKKKWAVLVGQALAVPLIVAWIPQAVQAVFMVLGMGQLEFVEILSEPGLWQAFYLAFYIAAGLWIVLLIKEAIGAVEKAPGGRALARAVLFSIVPVLLFLAFVR